MSADKEKKLNDSEAFEANKKDGEEVSISGTVVSVNISPEKKRSLKAGRRRTSYRRLRF